MAAPIPHHTPPPIVSVVDSKPVMDAIAAMNVRTMVIENALLGTMREPGGMLGDIKDIKKDVAILKQARVMPKWAIAATLAFAGAGGAALWPVVVKLLGAP